MANYRDLKQVVKGIPASDGAGVKLTRIIGSPYLDMLDPFLLLDRFSSDDAQDYIAGFPAHPHRGFETVTYMLEGRMRHEDSVGNSGIIETGGVQWMTAGRGIVHSEMPEQQEGLMSGFQLWVNLPSHAKMTQPGYQEHPSAAIKTDNLDNGINIKVIAGITENGVQGVIDNPYVNAYYWDVTQPATSKLDQTLPVGHNAFVYVFEGRISIEGHKLATGQLAVLTDGERLAVEASEDARYLVIAGKPLNEPVVRGGPFVMNTEAELRQAFFDYQTGRF